jgi:hypothetical protein
MKTDPKTSDYLLEEGASRNYEPWREVAKVGGVKIKKIGSTQASQQTGTRTHMHMHTLHGTPTGESADQAGAGGGGDGQCHESLRKPHVGEQT